MSSKCCCNSKDEREVLLKEVIEKHKDTKGALIPVLHEAQALYGYLPLEVQKIVSEEMGISLAEDLNIKDVRFEGETEDFPIDDLSPSIVRDPNKCILSRRCVSMCKEVQGVSVIETNERGFKTTVSPAFGKSLNDVPCTMCGQCINVCPVGALREKDDTEKVWDALYNDDLHVVVQTAPAVRVAIGEEFGFP